MGLREASIVMAGLILAMPGCFETSKQPSADESNTQSTTSTVNLPGPLPVGDLNSTTLFRMQLSQCIAFQGGTGPFVPETMPGVAPPGWEAGPLDPPISYIGYVGSECQRISVGGFERGPVRFVIEGHDKASVPPECDGAAARPTYDSVLSSFIVDDADIAAFLNSAYGLPATYGEITVAARTNGPVTEYEWTWGPAGMTPSTLTILHYGDESVDDTGDRYYWQRGQGIGAIQFHYDRPYPEQSFGHGKMEQPMLSASVADGNFAGPMRQFSEHSSEATFELYSDLFCEYPEHVPDEA